MNKTDRAEIVAKLVQRKEHNLTEASMHTIFSKSINGSRPVSEKFEKDLLHVFNITSREELKKMFPKIRFWNETGCLKEERYKIEIEVIESVTEVTLSQSIKILQAVGILNSIGIKIGLSTTLLE